LRIKSNYTSKYSCKSLCACGCPFNRYLSI